MYTESTAYSSPSGAGRPAPVQFTLLGSVQILNNGVNHAPTTPKILQVLAMLLASPGKVVHTHSMVTELWDGEPPRSFRTTLSTYVYHLRRCLEKSGLTTDGAAMLVTAQPGYLLRIDPGQVDLRIFQHRYRRARELLARQQYAEAAEAFCAALDRWNGPPLANVQCGPLLSAYAVELLEQRRSAYHLRIEAEISAGTVHELVGELKALVTANPLDESLCGQLIRVLAGCGRRSDAMACYRQLRAVLAEELGLEPSDELRLLYTQMLSEGDLRKVPRTDQ